MVKSIFLVASVALGPLSTPSDTVTQSFPALPEICPHIQMAQVAPRQNGRPQQQWCCCGACCGWALNCNSIPGCANCGDRVDD